MANLLSTAQQRGFFSTFLSVLDQTELSEMLNSEGPFTLLAPSDEAFARVPKETIDELMQHPHKLKQVLMYHVLNGDVRSDDLMEITEAPTAEGSNIIVEHNGKVKLDNTEVTEMDILADNGVIHVIDGVLIPSILGE